MSKPPKPKKHKIYLSEGESESVKPVKNPWIWFGLLALAVVITLWKYYMFDDTKYNQAMQESRARLETIQKEQTKLQKMMDRPDKGSKKRTRD